MTRSKAIRAKCIDCCGGDKKEVRLCTCVKCPLYPYRMGRASASKENHTETFEVEKSAGFEQESCGFEEDDCIGE